jgi:hypothetical protein
LLLRRHRFQSRLSCCRGSREEVFSYPRLCWLGAALSSPKHGSLEPLESQQPRTTSASPTLGKRLVELTGRGPPV